MDTEQRAGIAADPVAAVNSAAVRVVNLTFEYPSKRALHDVTFSVEPGAVVAMVGPNGAGKTTLLRCLAALEMPFSGSVRVLQVSSEDDPRQVHRHVGYLSDFFGLYGEISTRRCLLHAGAMQGLSDAELQTSIDQAIEDLELKEYLDQPAGSLSRGLRQRVAIAQAIIHSPKVLLMDEPASGLDPEARGKLAQLIRRLSRQGMTVIVSSHILSELESYCTHMLTIEEGRVLGYTSIDGSAEAAGGRFITIRLATGSPAFAVALEANPALRIVETSENEANVQFAGSDAEQAALLAALIREGFQVASFSDERGSMHDIYMAQLEQKRAMKRQDP